MDKLVVGVAVIAALASGTYAYMMRGELDREKALVTAAQQSMSTSKRAADDAARTSAVTKASLETCTTRSVMSGPAGSRHRQAAWRVPKALSWQQTHPSFPGLSRESGREGSEAAAKPALSAAY